MLYFSLHVAVVEVDCFECRVLDLDLYFLLFSVLVANTSLGFDDLVICVSRSMLRRKQDVLGRPQQAVTQQSQLSNDFSNTTQLQQLTI